MQKGMRPKSSTSTDQSVHIAKQEATVFNQEGMRPKFKTCKEKFSTSSCAEKNCQSTQCEHMQPVKLAMTQPGHM